tara:strand:- start:235 stop:642 length:408 start_codon:yes stop_codon:yes gene_type:complete
MNKKKFDLLLTLKKVKKNKSISGLNTLNKEKEKLQSIQKSLNKLLKTSSFPEGEVMTSTFLRHISTYQNQIQEKLDTTLNRQKYLSTEILQNIKNLSKLNKQTDTIEKRINEIEKENIQLKENKNQVNLLNKPSL